MKRRFAVDRLLFRGSSLDPLVYKFVLIMLLLAIFANCVRLVLSLSSYPGEIFPYAGTPISITFLGGVTFALWRKPHLLRPIVAIIFVTVTLRIGFQLTYILFVSKTPFALQLVWLSGLMSINYLAPFIIFRSKVASILALTTLAFWVALTGVYAVTHWEMESLREMVVVLSQLYVAHGILIIFMALFVKLQSLYLHTQKSAFHLERLAYTDSLLGTANRRWIQTQLKNRMEQRANTPLSVVLLDIDHFKEVNDQHGHHVGDEVLVEVADLISRYSRFDDFGRWGGEEFLVVLPNSSVTDAYKFSERIRSSMETFGFRVGQVTASFGIAEIQEGEDLDSLLKRADAALYKSKKLGRNRVEIAD